MFNIIIISKDNYESKELRTGVRLFSHCSVNEAYTDLKKISFDIIIIDINVCEDGIITALEILRSIQKSPIWLISPHYDSVTRLATGRLGVTNILSKFPGSDNLYDYLISFVDNLKSVSAISNLPESIMTIGNLSFNTDELTIQYKDGKWISLQAKQASVLKYLMTHPDQTVSFDTIFHKCFEYPLEYEVGDSELKLIRTQISILRTLLKRASNGIIDGSLYIKTEVNRGYKFVPSIE